MQQRNTLPEPQQPNKDSQLLYIISEAADSHKYT